MATIKGHMKFEIVKGTFFNKTVWSVYFENHKDPLQPYAGLFGQYDTFTAAKNAIDAA
jgi:hypothetical protein